MVSSASARGPGGKGTQKEFFWHSISLGAQAIFKRLSLFSPVAARLLITSRVQNIQIMLGPTCWPQAEMRQILFSTILINIYIEQ